MPIKYPSKYSPRYYNPNWGPYDHQRISWDYHNPKPKPKPVTKPAPNPKSPKGSSSIPSWQKPRKTW